MNTQDTLRWKLPLRADNQGSYIFDADGHMIAEIRGWGHLTGGGGLRLDEDTAVEVQKARGQALAQAVNEAAVARIAELETDVEAMHRMKARRADERDAALERAEKAEARIHELGKANEALREQVEGQAREDGTNGVLGAYHVQLDALGAPLNRWPCVRVSRLVEAREARIRELEQQLAALRAAETGSGQTVHNNAPDVSPEALRGTAGSRPLRPDQSHIKSITGALLSAITAHGPITRELVPSAVKRIAGQLRAAETGQGWQPIETAPSEEWVRVCRNYTPGNHGPCGICEGCRPTPPRAQPTTTGE